MKFHFIAIGGSVMHSLALSLHQAGHQITGSDDQLYDPARSRLAAAGLLPATEGWDPSRIHAGLDGVILGMHAFEDNPELSRARELGIPVYSYPEFIYERSRNKHRIVVAGSFGKTTVTSMIMHVLQGAGYKFDYLVGAGIPGFDNPVRLTDDAPMIVMEGDEYLASRTDPRPKFLLYHAHMVIISGIEWDHINVFPTFASYLSQFEQLVKDLDKAADIVYNEEDERVVSLVKAHTDDRSQYLHPFQTPSYRVRDGVFEVKLEGERAALQVIGKHNMANIAAAWEACKWLGMEIDEFITHIRTFTGAKLRQEKVYEDASLTIIRDYAHAPAKVLATVDAVRERYKKKKITACLELHSFSSLNKAYLPYYKGAMKKADRRIVYVNPQAVEHRRMEQISQEEMLKAFGDPAMLYVTSREALKKALKEGKSEVLLMMSSGNFDGLPMSELAG